MVKKILGVSVVLVVGFLAYVSTREGHFRYERSGLIAAPASEIYPIISNLKRGREWSPYEKKDPNMKETFRGAPDGQVGSVLEFEGNSETGSGTLEIVNLVPNESVRLKLTMTKPFHAENLIDYRLTPEAGGTRFSWALSGDGGFLGKLMSTFIDCEKMMTKDFDAGIANVKAIAEAKR